MKKAAITLLILAAPPAVANGDRTYIVHPGDTLSSISLRIFGEAHSWPKLWALNGKKIPNPHLIRPSTVLRFSSGSLTSMPNAMVTDSIHSSAAAPKRKRSEEWRDLPPQPWEEIQVSLPENVDQLGFDLKTRYVFPRTNGIELPWIAASAPLQEIGTIVAARGENKFLTFGDFVYVREEGQGLQEGKTLAISTTPSVLKTSFFGRKGYGYPVLGKIKILGKKQGVWVGQIQEARASIERDSCFLIENPPRAIIREPVAAGEPISATFIIERGSDVKFSAQHKIAFIDRGTNDGITEGMILRAYQNRDPFDDRKITSNDVVVSGDVQVIQASERFSTVLVINTVQEPIENGTPLVALTDVTELKRQKINLATDVDLGEGVKSEPPATPEQVSPETAPPPAGDELDSLEQKQGLTPEEKSNLQQLEKQKPQSEEVPTSPPEKDTTEGSSGESASPIPEKTSNPENSDSFDAPSESSEPNPEPNSDAPPPF